MRVADRLIRRLRDETGLLIALRFFRTTALRTAILVGIAILATAAPAAAPATPPATRVATFGLVPAGIGGDF